MRSHRVSSPGVDRPGVKSNNRCSQCTQSACHTTMPHCFPPRNHSWSDLIGAAIPPSLAALAALYAAAAGTWVGGE
eukprot:353311-Chlamydomonas_euryale.AAC.2